MIKFFRNIRKKLLQEGKTANYLKYAIGEIILVVIGIIIALQPQQLDDVTNYPLITKALIEKGYSEKDIDKILGANLLRVLKANETN